MYTGDEKTVIKLGEAKTNIGETIIGRHIDFTSTYFSQKALKDLLNVPNAVGIRYYPGKITHEGQIYKTLVAVAVDADGNDLTEDGEIALGEGPCPIHCGGNGMWP